VSSRLARNWPLLIAGLVVVVAALVFTHALGTRTNYDEGVYLESLAALRRGQALGSDVYTSQPPAFYWLLRVLAAPFGSSIAGIRVGFALLAVVGVAAAIAVGWRLYGPAAGIAAGALVAIGPPYPTVAPTVSADVPSVALGLVSLALVVFAVRRRASRAWSVGAGAVLALACLTKLLAIPFVVPFAAIALAHRAGRRVFPSALLGAAALAVAVAVADVRVLGDIWTEVVTDHTNARALGSYSANIDQIRRLLDLHTPFGWLVPLGFLAFVASREARRTWPLWTFVPAAAGFLFLVRPLADHHMVLLSVAYALAAGPSLALAAASLPRRARAAAAAVLVLFVAAGVYQEQRRLHRNDLAEPAEVSWAVAAVHGATGPRALVVTDQPIVVFRARRATYGPLVDVSNTRVNGGTLTAADVLTDIGRSRPDAVLVDRMFRFLPVVLADLDRRYPYRVSCGTATLYLRSYAQTPPCPVHS
jgi:4-amino-4-deoxy-L-arabinose transferase-like glycosyltransferase